MSLQNINMYIKTNIDKILFDHFLKENNFINIKESYEITYKNIKFEVLPHKYIKDNYSYYCFTFTSINNELIEYNSYKALSNKFFSKMIKDCCFELSECNVSFILTLQTDLMLKKLQKSKFRKPYEELDVLTFKDTTNQNELIFRHDEFSNNKYEYQLLINNVSSPIDIDKTHSYIKRIMNICR